MSQVGWIKRLPRDTDGDVKEWVMLVGIVIAFAIVMTVCVGGGLIAQYATERAECRQIAETAQVDTTFRLWAGCFVKVGDRFVPVERWRVLSGT